METARLAQVKRIFQEIRDTPEAGRAAALAAASAGDAELRARVEALLDADSDAGQFLASPTREDPTTPMPAEPSNLFERLQRAVSGRYSLERELGRGGMGVVFLARDVALDRAVAIKVLPPSLADEHASRARFIREARTAAGLSHPNIVPIHLVEEKDELVYFVMALVDGESLGDRLRRTGPLKASDAARLVQEVAWALGYAHGRGVIHRDIKPDNILIDKGSGRALVTDFGIARVTTSGTVSQQGEVLGTMRYMSPEQASADAVIDGRSDLYSLGITAYLALTGRLPFESDNPMALIAMQVTQPAPPLKSVARTVPTKLAEAIDRCLAKDPSARFATGEALAESIAESQATVREIAPSVREFIESAKTAAITWYSLGLLWWIMLALVGDVTRAPVTEPGRVLIGNPLAPAFFILTFLSLIAVIMPVNATRKVLRAGLDERDVADAIARSNSARDANVEYELSRVERLGTRMSSIVGRGAFLVVGMVLARTVLGSLFRSRTMEVERLLAHLAGVAGAALVLAPALAPKRTLLRVLNSLTRGTPEYADLFRKMWAGPFGRWTFRVAGFGVRRAKTRVIQDSAPTEVLLGRAAGDVFEQLPTELRKRLGDVPDVIRKLETAAASLRKRRDQLRATMAEAGTLDGSSKRGNLAAELASAIAVVEERHGSAVSAIESLRLDLLRLRAGIGSADDLTASLTQARTVGTTIDNELSAHRQVESLIGGR
jgi:predicted Ser/Thr protein kinase